MREVHTATAERSIHNSIQITIGLLMGRTQHVARHLEYLPLNDPAEHAPPTMVLPMYAAQQLMDELWNCGLRPSLQFNTQHSSLPWVQPSTFPFNVSSALPCTSMNQPAATLDGKQ